MKSAVKWLALVAILAMALTPVASVEAGAPNPETFVFVTIGGGPDSLDGAYAYDSSSGAIIYQLYDNLIQYDGESLERFKPMLATKVPSVENGLISKDGLTYKFPIRKGVKFHNGDILTPEDVEYTFERNMLADPDGGPMWMILEPLLGTMTIEEYAMKKAGVDSFDKVDEATLREVAQDVKDSITVEGDYVVFHLAKPYPPFLGVLAKNSSWSVIMNKDWMIANGAWDGSVDNWTKWHNLPKEKMVAYDRANGTGPFKLKVWDHNNVQVVLERFDDYWQGPAKLKTVYVKYIDEYNTRKLMLEKGEADAVYVDPQYLSQVRMIPGVVTLTKPEVANRVALFNESIPIEGNPDVGSGKLDGNGIPSDFFADVHVRKAFAYSMDYDALIDQVLAGLGKRIVGPIPSSIPFVNPDQKVYNFDLKKAEEEFKKAHGGKLWEKGFKMTITYNSGNEVRKTAAEIIEANIESINPKFQIDVRPVEWATYLDNLRSGYTTMFFMGWIADYADAHNFVQPYMQSSGAFAGYMGDHFIQRAKEKYDPLIEKGINSIDPEVRKEVYYKLQELAYEDATAIWLYEAERTFAMRDWVKGFEYNPICPADYNFYKIYKE
ncbi:MAG: ABC transporter substrate-binding protein [Firmicutes bacterium]|nr:ABC transporter substrate-binding protein [Bacillota bacterium]